MLHATPNKTVAIRVVNPGMETEKIQITNGMLLLDDLFSCVPLSKVNFVWHAIVIYCKQAWQRSAKTYGRVGTYAPDGWSLAIHQQSPQQDLPIERTRFKKHIGVGLTGSPALYTITRFCLFRHLTSPPSLGIYVHLIHHTDRRGGREFFLLLGKYHLTIAESCIKTTSKSDFAHHRNLSYFVGLKNLKVMPACDLN